MMKINKLLFLMNGIFVCTISKANSNANASEIFIEQTKVYGIVKPTKITTLIGINQGIVTHIEHLGSLIDKNQMAVTVIERETTREYRSTIKGTVAKIHVTEGAAITPGMPLITILDPTMKEIEVSFSPQESQKIKLGAAVVSSQNVPFGVIDKMSPLVDPDTGAVLSFIKPKNHVNETIGDIIPLYVETGRISDCDQIELLDKVDTASTLFNIRSISGNKACLKKNAVSNK